jgi:hypothetical protein
MKDKAMKKMKNVYVLVINQNNMGNAEDLSTVVAHDIDSLIDYVVNEELPEQGYDSEFIEEMGVVDALSDNMYWTDPNGVDYIINESKLVG